MLLRSHCERYDDVRIEEGEMSHFVFKDEKIWSNR